MRHSVGMIAAFVLTLSSVTFADLNADHKVAIHILPHEVRTCKRAFPVFNSCTELISTYEGCGDIDVFPVFFDLAGVTVLDYGLTWPQAWGSCTFTVCAGSFRIGDIIWPGDGIAQAWGECCYDGSVVAGYGWLYADTPGSICPVPNPATGNLWVVDCDAESDLASQIFCAGACGQSGDDPCSGSPPNQPKTWGKIKSIFR